MSSLSSQTSRDATRRATEAALCTATVELLGQGIPFPEIGIEQIVRRAGYTRPDFYAHFRDKRELILRLGEAVHDSVAAAADPWLTQARHETRQNLAAVLAAFRSHQAVLGALLAAAAYDPEIRNFWRGFHIRFAAIARERISAAHPELDAAHVEARAHILVLMTERAMTEHITAPTVETDALLDELARLWREAGAGAD